MKKLAVLILFIFQFLLGQSQVIFKNTGDVPISVAICYGSKLAAMWTSMGWYSVNPGEEKAVFTPSVLTNNSFYYCAQIQGCDQGYFGDTKLFVNATAGFKILNADKPQNTTDRNIITYGFNLVNLQGQNRYVIELKPRNLTCYGQKEGKWIFGLDKEGNFAEKTEDIVFYRQVTFNKGNVVGWCKDIYADNTLKSEFKLLSYSPFVYDGKCTWYKRDGSIEKEVVYRNGSAVSMLEKDQNGISKVRQAKYDVVKMPIQQFYINSTGNESLLGGRSKTAIPISLPEGTVKWYYEFTASRDKAQVEVNSRQFQLASNLSKMLDGSGVLSVSIDILTTPPGGDLCNVYLMDGSFYNPFLTGKQFSHYPTGSRLNFKSGVVQIEGMEIPNPTLGISNPSLRDGIHLSIQIVAVVSKI